MRLDSVGVCPGEAARSDSPRARSMPVTATKRTRAVVRAWRDFADVPRVPSGDRFLSWNEYVETHHRGVADEATLVAPTVFPAFFRTRTRESRSFIAARRCAEASARLPAFLALRADWRAFASTPAVFSPSVAFRAARAIASAAGRTSRGGGLRDNGDRHTETSHLNGEFGTLPSGRVARKPCLPLFIHLRKVLGVA